MRSKKHEELVNISNQCIEAVFEKVKKVLEVFLEGNDNSNNNYNNNSNNSDIEVQMEKMVVVLCKIFMENCKLCKAVNLKSVN